jgi:hypothetical protein
MLIALLLPVAFGMMGGCAAQIRPQPIPAKLIQQIECTAWQPIRVSPNDILTDQTARAILSHDETGERLCGWKPNGKP